MMGKLKKKKFKLVEAGIVMEMQYLLRVFLTQGSFIYGKLKKIILIGYFVNLSMGK